ncbi:MAG TPA: hypothetical protein DIV86_00015 [Alphaproteobacteria bacterium]|mgnify:CR=1 FL=1|nr:hypothetical protein [Alphaproteobacteria bacterium]
MSDGNKELAERIRQAQDINWQRDNGDGVILYDNRDAGFLVKAFYDPSKKNIEGKEKGIVIMAYRNPEINEKGSFTVLYNFYEGNGHIEHKQGVKSIIKQKWGEKEPDRVKKICEVPEGRQVTITIKKVISNGRNKKRYFESEVIEYFDIRKYYKMLDKQSKTSQGADAADATENGCLITLTAAVENAIDPKGINVE